MRRRGPGIKILSSFHLRLSGSERKSYGLSKSIAALSLAPPEDEGLGGKISSGGVV